MASVDSVSVTSPVPGSFTGSSSRSRSSTRVNDDVMSLTSFNPFSEEDENEQSSYTLVTSLLSRMKNSFAAPLSSHATTSTSNTNPSPNPGISQGNSENRRPSYAAQATSHTSSNFSSSRNSNAERPFSIRAQAPAAAPPLVSLTPAQSELPTYSTEYDRSPSRGAFNSLVFETGDGVPGGTSIPGFPIQDDARSIKTAASLQRTGSVSKVMRRLRGEGLSRDYWMDDATCKECYDCKSVFTTWRRKHHCRICGQIFCSRCASNIIKGTRFGYDGMVRVCNLCLQKLAKVEEDDDDDRRSISSSVTSFPAHQHGLQRSSPAQSPFAASQLFGSTDEPFNLYSIAETKQPLNPYGSRPVTPLIAERDDGMWEQENPAPFRRPLTDEDPGTPPNPFQNGESSPTAPGSKTPHELTLILPAGNDGNTSSIQFPLKSPENAIDSPVLQNRLKNRLDSFGEIDPSTPFIRSRVHSRMDSLLTGEPGWRTRRESTAYAQELNLTSMLHLKVMLRQMLTSEQIPNSKEWEEVLLKLALRIARELTFTSLPHRQGEDMDVRKYVKIKKIPGGAPSDSEYVEGAVITKNVAHKQMQRSIRNPRIMLVTFPLEFHRVEGQYMHFGQIVRQEKEYLGNLASRIAALRPHVVLVDQSVSRLALDALAESKIAVARSVKASAIQTIARMTQGDVFSSMDKLALEPRLGHCAHFRIRTYDHPLIPGRRKTYMRFEGCSRDMGCTIILRGASIDILRRLKKVTRFLTFIVRNLKLETHLWKDSVITLPPFNPDAVPLSMNGRVSTPPSAISVFSPTSVPTPRPFVPKHQHGTATITEVDSDAEDPQDDGTKQLQLSRKIDDSLDAYIHTFISVSATLRFPPPYPLRRMKDLDNELIKSKQEWEDEVIRREERQEYAQSQHAHEPTVTAATAAEISQFGPSVANDTNDLNAQIEALPSLILAGDQPLIETPMSISGIPEVNSYFLYPGGSVSNTEILNTTIANTASAAKLTPELLKTIDDIGPESKYTLLKWKHEEQRRIWQWYLRKNPDDFIVEKYQCISLWQFTLPTVEVGKHQPCFAPQLIYITFYGENDCTLGQFIERSVNDTLAQFLDPKAICTGKGCDKPLARHCKVFVHNETRITIAVEQWDGQIIGRQHHHPSPDLITTWSACRICGSATPFIPVSEEMQRYSFAKFLELHFYPADVQLVQGAGCHHNIYQHHVRFFACKGLTVRFQSEDITLHEAVFPPFKIRVRPETQLQIKNADFERLHQRNLMWYSALIDDLKLISIDAAIGDEEADAKLLADINALILRAEAEREDICSFIHRIYRESSPADTFALNQVHAYRQDKIVAWQQDFDRLPKPRPLQVGDRKSQRTSAFGSVRAMWPRRYDLAGTFEHPPFPSSNVSEAEGPLNNQRVTGESFTSSASEVSESETNEDTSEKISIPTANPQNPTVQEKSTKQPIKEDIKIDPSPSQLVNENSDIPKSEPESDSTIGAGGGEESNPPVPTNPDESAPDDGSSTQRLSRLPRRTNPPNVSELVKKYQDYLPAQGVHDLTKTALSPRTVFSESEQEYVPPMPRRLPTRNKTRHHPPPRKASTSDFEQSYAANIAPRYLAPSRRPQGTSTSRIPGPITATVSAIPSRSQSRRPSPEKRPSESRIQTRTSRPPSPVLQPVPNAKGKHRRMGHSRERTQLRPPPTPSSRSAFRRPPAVTGNKVSTMAKHFERLGRDAERAKSRYTVIRGKRARPVASARAKVEILDSIKDAIRDESESSDSSSEADDEDEGIEERPRLPTEPPSLPEINVKPPASEPPVQTAPPLVEVSDSNGIVQAEPEAQELEVPVLSPELVSLPPSPFLASMKQDTGTPPTSDVEYGGGTAERNSILRAISGFWQNTGSRFSFDDDPMNDPEHIFRDFSMIVRTDEPTSIIALALNSPQYREMLAKSRAEKRTAREAKLNESGEAFMPDDKSMAESSSTWGVVNVDSTDLADPTEDLRVPSSKLPWAVSFESGGLIISCTILYPEQFDALRRTYDCDKSMIESLSRCVKWNASGGKSGSAFLKTGDDRFIAKELSRPELQTMETFAPAYFDYMSSAVSNDRPTLLAKVFGCFKISFKQTGKDKGPGKAKSTQMNLLVMENLFYDRSYTKIYDLKGSTRNRHVQSTGRKNEVLLDENLVETAHLNPFYLREHSKRILRGALYNDSKFLADINVMDYSLVCGVDSQNNELVVGIVDYIRTYTWDKKLESWVKESAFLGGRGEPTIVTPKQYRQRFISAMERYFPLVPDRWMKQKDTPEEDPNCLTELWPDW